MESDFNNLELRKFDGTLLLIFRELLLRRRATEVAQRLGLSPSAISHALTRLRELFNDPLFIRRSHGLEPTERALELGPRVEALLELANATLSPRGMFDPSRSRRRFSFAAPGGLTALIGPGLLEAFMREAPGSSFVSRRLILDQAVDALRRGEVDLAFGAFGRTPQDIVAEVLYEERWCVLARQGHPVIRGAIDLKNYAELEHLWVGHPTPGMLDEAPHDPEVAAVTYGTIPGPELVRTVGYVPQIETAMLMVATSDAVADCPERLARRYADRLGLQVLDSPYEGPPITIQALRRRGPADAGVDWLLGVVRSAVAAAPA